MKTKRIADKNAFKLDYNPNEKYHHFRRIVKLSFRMEFFPFTSKIPMVAPFFSSFVYNSWRFFYAAVWLWLLLVATRAKMNFSLPERVCSSVGIVDALMLRLASRVLLCLYLYLFRFLLLFFSSFNKFDILPQKETVEKTHEHTHRKKWSRTQYTCKEAKDVWAEDWLLHHCARAIIEKNPRDDQRILQWIVLLLLSFQMYEMRLKRDSENTRTLKILLLYRCSNGYRQRYKEKNT